MADGSRGREVGYRACSKYAGGNTRVCIRSIRIVDYLTAEERCAARDGGVGRCGAATGEVERCSRKKQRRCCLGNYQRANGHHRYVRSHDLALRSDGNRISSGRGRDEGKSGDGRSRRACTEDCRDLIPTTGNGCKCDVEKDSERTEERAEKERHGCCELAAWRRRASAEGP